MNVCNVQSCEIHFSYSFSTMAISEVKAVYKLSTMFIHSQVVVFTLAHKMSMGTNLLKLTTLIL